MTRRRGGPQHAARGTLFARIQRLTRLLDQTTDRDEKARIRERLATLRNRRAEREDLDDND